MTAVDTSVVVAAFASWHEAHEAALSALDSRPALPAQAALEAYSVLTRLPAPHRAAATVVRDFIDSNFADMLISLNAEEHRSLLSELTSLGMVGGAAYDAVIGVTARTAGLTLITMDARARRTYDQLGVSVQVIG